MKSATVPQARNGQAWAREPEYGPDVRRWNLHFSGLFWLSALTLLVALVFGGGTRAGFGGDVLVQLAGVGLLAAAIAGLARIRQKLGVGARLAIAFCLCLAAVPFLQLIPLPAVVRGLLPGSLWVNDSYRLIGRDAPWWPLSLAPEATWISLLSLIAPIALLLGVLQLGYRERRYLVTVLIAFAMLSVFLGALQLAQGVKSPMRFYAITNDTEAVGFFANRNHYAALLYCATLLTASFAVNAVVQFQSAFRLSGWNVAESRRVLVLAGTLVVFIALVMAQAMARSRAGIVFTIAGLFGVLGVAATDRRSSQAEAGGARIVMGAAIAAVVLSLQYALIRIIERFSEDPIEQTRIIISSKTLEAAKDFLPFGAGTGAFVPVYALLEAPGDVRNFYANHAHNDVAESLLESGVLSFALMAAFGVFLARHSYAVWSGKGNAQAGDLDLGLVKAATLAVLFLALHSFVDYPLRTSAGMAIAALCCGLLLTPLREDRPQAAGRAHQGDARHPDPIKATEHDGSGDAGLRSAIAEAMGRANAQASGQAEGRPWPTAEPQGRAWPPPGTEKGRARERGPDETASRGFERWQSEGAWPEKWRSRAPSHQDAPRLHDDPGSSSGPRTPPADERAPDENEDLE